GPRVEPTPRRWPAAPRPGLVADFRSGMPDLSGVPRADWLWAVREAARTMPAVSFGYGDPRGNERLRAVVAAYLRRVRAVAADPAYVVVCTGFGQGLNLVLRALSRGGVRR